MNKRLVRKVEAKKRNITKKHCNFYMDSTFKKYSCTYGSSGFANVSCIPTRECADRITQEGRKALTMIERHFKLQKLMGK